MKDRNNHLPVCPLEWAVWFPPIQWMLETILGQETKGEEVPYHWVGTQKVKSSNCSSFGVNGTSIEFSDEAGLARRTLTQETGGASNPDSPILN